MSNNTNSEFIDYSGLLKQVRSKWYWFLISIIVCGGIGWLSTLLIRPIYKVKANIMLTEQTPMSKFISAGLGGSISDFFGGNASTEDEMRIATSHSMLESVVKDLQLNIAYYRRLAPKNYLRETEESPLKLVVDDSTIDLDTLHTVLTFRVSLSAQKKASVTVTAPGVDKLFSGSDITLPAKIATDYGTFSLQPTPKLTSKSAGRYRITVESPSTAAEDLRDDLTVEAAGKNSKIISLQMITDNEQLSIDILNSLIKSYNQRSRNDQDSQNSTTVNFINNRLNDVRGQLASAESTLTEYKEHRGLAVIEADGTSYYERMANAEKMLIQQQLVTEKARLTLDIARASAKDNSLIPPYEESAGLIDSYNSLLMRRTSLEASSKPDNLALQRLDEQITLVRNNLITALESGVESSMKLEKQYRTLYQQAQDAVGNIPEIEESYRKIARHRAVEEELYLYLLKKQEEIQVLFANLNPKAKIIDPAFSLNEDISRSPEKTIFVALLIGLLLPIFYFYARYQLFKK